MSVSKDFKITIINIFKSIKKNWKKVDNFIRELESIKKESNGHKIGNLMSRFKRILDLEKTGLFNWKKGKTGQTKELFFKKQNSIVDRWGTSKSNCQKWKTEKILKVEREKSINSKGVLNFTAAYVMETMEIMIQLNHIFRVLKHDNNYSNFYHHRLIFFCFWTLYKWNYRFLLGQVSFIEHFICEIRLCCCL